MKWVIKDWMNNHCFTDKTFNSFEEARDFISEIADHEAMTQTSGLGIKDGNKEYEEIYNGICEDLYAEEVKQSPQEFIWEYVQLQNTKIAKYVYNNLNKEKYWLTWTNGKEAYWNFEHNSLESIPNRDYNYIKKVLKSNGYKYYAD